MRVLMSPPTFLRVGPDASWSGEALCRPRAMTQWRELRQTVAELGAEVIEVSALPWAPALTFTRDHGIAAPTGLVATSPLGARGLFEGPPVAHALSGLGVTTSEPVAIDGGNVVSDSRGRTLVGTVAPDDPGADVVAALGRAGLGPIIGVPRSPGRFAHLDMVLADLAGRAWLAYPPALPGFSLEAPEWQELFAGAPVIELTDAEAEALAANVFLVGDTVITGCPSSRVRAAIEAVDLPVRVVDLDAFVAAGAGARCLTLPVNRR